ncbi:MAG: hypothetical protein PHT03_04695 [Bacilli bacterium]|nr:hypothetical protein [Bacilli bacterium]
MRKLAFKFRFAYRNLTGKNILFSFAVLFLLIIFLTLSLIVASHKPMITKIFYHQAKDRYLNIDMTLTYDENSTLKIVNQRRIGTEYRDYFDYYAIFYNFYSIIEGENESFYGHIFSSDITGFNRVIDYPVDNIGKREAVISESTADNNQLIKGGTLTMYFGGKEYEFRIKAIIPDRGIFTDNAVFILKDDLLHEIIGPGTHNLGNTIYFRLKSDISVDNARSALNADSEYGQYLITPTVDYEYIDYYTRYGSSFFMAIGVVVIFALVLIIRSVFSLYFKDFNAQYAVINILGGSRLMAFKIWVYQLLMLTGLALPPAVVISNYLFNIAAQAFEVKSIITLPFLSVLVAVLFYLFILVYELIHRYRILQKESLVYLSKDKRSNLEINQFPILLLIIFYIINNSLSGFNIGIKALINIILILVLSVLLLGLIIELFSCLFKLSKKRTVFNTFTVKHLKSSKIVAGSLKVIMISMVIIAAVLSVIRSVRKNNYDFRRKLKADYLIANISDYNANLKNDLIRDYPINVADEAVFFQDVYIKDYEKGIPFFLSVEYDNIDYYYSLSLNEEVRSRFAQTENLYILLPESFSYIYQAEIDDIITIRLSPTLGDKDFIIAGFFSTEYDTFVFTNYLSYSGGNAANSLIFNSGPFFSVENKGAIIKQYSSKMYLLVDIKKTADAVFSQSDQVINILLWVFWFIVGGFVIVIINNSLLTFSVLKADFAKLKILGLDDWQLGRNIIKEVMFIVAIAVTIAFVVLVLLFPNFSPMMLVFGYYKEIAVSGDELLKFLNLGALIYIASYLIYYFKIRSINVIDTIRKF